MKAILGMLVIVSMVNIGTEYTGEPEHPLWGYPQNVTYNAGAHEWKIRNAYPDNLFRAMDAYDCTHKGDCGFKHRNRTERIPEKKRIVIRFDLFWRRDSSQSEFQAAVLMAGARREKVLFVNGPSQDPSDRFFGWPTPLLHAIAPTVDAVRKGTLELSVSGPIFDPWSYTKGVNDEQVKASFRDRAKNVDIICASAIYDGLYPTLQLFAEAKRLNPDVVTILGGPHFDEVHAIPELNNVALHPTLVDYAVAGDGEIVLRELLRELSCHHEANLDAVARRSAGRAWLYDCRGNKATVCTSLILDELPIMPIELASDHHRLDFDVFTGDNGTLPTVQMIAARGCPYSCSFCSEQRELAYPNARSIEHIIAEVELRKQQGFKAVFFDDSTFGAYPKIKDLLRELGTTGMRFGSLNRFNLFANQGIAEEYRKAGFEYVYCAIEQFDDDALRGMTKKQNTGHIGRGMQNLASVGFSIGVSLLYGLPYETERSINATLDFTKQWVDCGAVKLVSESVLSYHPGTPEGRGKKLDFNRTPPNLGHPWNRFEEGQWYHPQHVTAAYLEKIFAASEQRFSQALVRNRHSWVKRA